MAEEAARHAPYAYALTRGLGEGYEAMKQVGVRLLSPTVAYLCLLSPIYAYCRLALSYAYAWSMRP